MSNFPSEYGSLPNLREQAGLWLATLPVGILSVWGTLAVDALRAKDGIAWTPDSIHYSIFVITFLSGAVFGCLHHRFHNFLAPWFSVTWRAYIWTLVVAAIPDPFLLIGIVLIPTFSLTGWGGMISGYFVGFGLRKLVARWRA